MAFLTVAEFAEEQGVSPSTVRRWAKLGMPTTVCNGLTCVEPDLAEGWLDDHAAESDDGADDEVEEVAEDLVDSDEEDAGDDGDDGGADSDDVDDDDQDDEDQDEDEEE